MAKFSPTLLLPFLLPLRLVQAGPYAAFHTTGYIPFTDTTAIILPVDWSSKVKVDLTVNSFASTARLFRPDVDTGTCGFLFASKDLPDWNPATEALATNKGWQFLSSSDLLYTGHWVARDIYFNPRSSATRIKATIPVLAVTKKVKCTSYDVSVGGDTCPTTPEWEDNNPSGRVMGVGFGREDDGQPQGTPDKNALINIQSVAGQNMTSYLQGYTIDSYGIKVGLTDDNTLGMTFQELPARNPNLAVGSRVPTVDRDWASLRSGCISFNDGADCYDNGEVLLDTGMGNSSMRVPTGVALPRDSVTKVLNDGTVVKVDLGDPALVTERFTAGTGAATGVTPDLAFAYNSDRGNFFNTGRHVYRAWKTAFDSVDGRYGIGAV